MATADQIIIQPHLPEEESGHSRLRHALQRMAFILTETKKVLVSIPRAFRLVWDAGPGTTGALLAVNVVTAVCPAAILWVTKLVIDQIGRLTTLPPAGLDMRPVWLLVGAQLALWSVQSGANAISSALTGLLRFRVEIHTQTLIMRKCGQLDVVFFENPRNLDMLENATHGAMMSAWSLIGMLVSLVGSSITLLTFLGVLIRLHWATALVGGIAAAPQMVVSAYYARRRWAMISDRAGDSRLRYYLTDLMSQRDAAKEVRVFDLMDTILDRFCYYSQKFFLHERSIEGRREAANLGDP